MVLHHSSSLLLLVLELQAGENAAAVRPLFPVLRDFFCDRQVLDAVLSARVDASPGAVALV